jgi:hypothetical protein
VSHKSEKIYFWVDDGSEEGIQPIELWWQIDEGYTIPVVYVGGELHDDISDEEYFMMYYGNARFWEYKEDINVEEPFTGEQVWARLESRLG